MALTRALRNVGISDVIKPVCRLPAGKGEESGNGPFQGPNAAFV
jgi:hypothetical protein